MPSKLDRHAEQLSALGHPIRLAILRFVVQGGAGRHRGRLEIQEHVDLPASTLSHHLKRLVDAGLLEVAAAKGPSTTTRPSCPRIRALTDYVWEDCCKRGKAKCC